MFLCIMALTFTENSLTTRCIHDIEQFLSLQEQNNNTSFIPLQQFVDEIKSTFLKKLNQPESQDILFHFRNNIIEPLLSEMEGLLSTYKIDWKDFDYSHNIVKLSLQHQQNLWLLRTSLFYNLMILSAKLCQNEELFRQTFQNRTEFHEAVSNSIGDYKLGIYGSLNPTSDIDVGLQYSGTSIDNGLSYLTRLVENVFILFTSFSSLKFDVELYADMMTITNTVHGKALDIFYLDSSNFEEEDFQKMIPYIEASILRNYVTAKLPETPRTPEDIVKCFETFSYSSFFEELDKTKELQGFHMWFQSLNIPFFRDTVSPYAKDLVLDYMSRDYDSARETYYERVNTAEQNVGNIRRFIVIDKQFATKDAIVQAMQLIAESLVYRAESYTCSDSVMHVVRVLQASSPMEKQKKYPVNFPECHNQLRKSLKAICNIGMYGYITSIFEQLGYIYRFYLTYCLENGHEDITKCAKKREKYVGRVADAMKKIKDMLPRRGGKISRKRRSKKRKCVRKSYRR